jgi:hypothetical protein
MIFYNFQEMELEESEEYSRIEKTYSNVEINVAMGEEDENRKSKRYEIYKYYRFKIFLCWASKLIRAVK